MPERAAVRDAIAQLHLTPVLFELGARPHPPRDFYRAYLDQSQIFVGIYWQRYGWVAPDMDISGLEDEYQLSGDRPKLIYIKTPAPEREQRLSSLLDQIRDDDKVSYRPFSTPEELRSLVKDDLAILLTERFERSQGGAVQATVQAASNPVDPAPRRTNLPVQRGSLVGREREVDIACSLLLRDDVGLVTLTGPGGTGKTRLGLHVASDLLQRFPDGAWLVSLAPVSDPGLVVSAIADALQVREAGSQPLLERLRDHLRGRELLLVLDNFEQVVDAAPAVADLLPSCPKLKVLVTSRTPLHLSGEKELPVLPLALPARELLSPGARDAGAERLTQYAAVEPFIQRALDVKPQFAVTKHNAPAIAEICHRLDGLPLAIELAARRSKLLSPEAMLARLEHRLPLLTSGARDLPARQQTMRGAIAWSYDLLDAEEQRLFVRLAVFDGGCTLEATESVCAGASRAGVGSAGARSRAGGALEIDVLDGIASLVDKSLLRQEDTPAGDVRFKMLQTIREFALERLPEADDEQAVRSAYAEYYLQLAEEAAPRLTGPDQIAWIARLDGENDNFRAALAWYEGQACREPAEAADVPGAPIRKAELLTRLAA
ncbi:MAG TPA: DUF4062 domain-containing protein, partial [Chloroflexota bacterium]|nr:DUF4062 domain-containing protein [Chloroflexota bacterium]